MRKKELERQLACSESSANHWRGCDQDSQRALTRAVNRERALKDKNCELEALIVALKNRQENHTEMRRENVRMRRCLRAIRMNSAQGLMQTDNNPLCPRERGRADFRG